MTTEGKPHVFQSNSIMGLSLVPEFFSEIHLRADNAAFEDKHAHMLSYKLDERVSFFLKYFSFHFVSFAH